MEIRLYTDSYKEQVIQLILKIQMEEFGVTISIKDQPDLQQICSFYQKGCGNFWVAIEGEKVVGTIALVDLGNQQTALRKMFVAQEYRGKEKGIAKALLQELIGWCKCKNICEIYLGTTAVFFAAHRFYEKNGFEEISKALLPATFPIMKVDSKFYVYRFSDISD